MWFGNANPNRSGVAHKTSDYLAILLLSTYFNMIVRMFHVPTVLVCLLMVWWVNLCSSVTVHRVYGINMNCINLSYITCKCTLLVYSNAHGYIAVQISHRIKKMTYPGFTLNLPACTYLYLIERSLQLIVELSLLFDTNNHMALSLEFYYWERNLCTTSN